MKLCYFPGCSQKGTNKACEEATQAVFRELGVELVELDDWNCCGATAYMSVDEQKALAVAARNLALAEKTGATEMVTPCSGCYLALNKANKVCKEYPEVGKNVKAALKSAGLDYAGTVRVRHTLDIIVNVVGLDVVKQKVKKPLTGVNIAAYYGCQTVRPILDFDDQHFPTSIDRLCEALGAKSVHFPLKTRCCGGSQMGTLPEVAQRLCYIILREAKKNGANAVVDACPLCHFNLDSYQPDINSMYSDNIDIPVIYFTQLMGLAFGISPKTLGLQRNISWDTSELARKQLVTA